MSSGGLLDEAVAELYAADPEEFTRRRQELADRARLAGQVPVAKQIVALRKPTRSAWVINQLARSDPGSASRLTALGAELRAAERSADGSKLRELSQVRRRLIASLVRQALAVSGQAAAPAAMREEVTSTFAAALADPDVAELIQRGMLLRAASRPGFGSAEAPALTVVPPLTGSQQTAVKAAKPKPAPAGPAPARPAEARPGKTEPEPARPSIARPAGTKPAPVRSAKAGGAAGARADTEAGAAAAKAGSAAGAGTQAEDGAGTARAGSAAGTGAGQRGAKGRAKAQQAVADADRAARAGAEPDRRGAKGRAKAEQAVADADRAALEASEDERRQQAAVTRLERELAEARHRLRMAAAAAREAEASQRKARQVLRRFPG